MVAEEGSDGGALDSAEWIDGGAIDSAEWFDGGVVALDPAVVTTTNNANDNNDESGVSRLLDISLAISPPSLLYC